MNTNLKQDENFIKTRRIPGVRDTLEVTFGFWRALEDGSHRKYCPTQISWKLIPEGEVTPKLFQISDTEAQDLMDDLWRLKIRPVDYKDPVPVADNSAYIQSLLNHIADLQKALEKKENPWIQQYPGIPFINPQIGDLPSIPYPNGTIIYANTNSNLPMERP